MTGTSFAVEPSRTTAFKISEKAKKNKVPIFLDLDFRANLWNNILDFGSVLKNYLKLTDIVIGTEEEVLSINLANTNQIKIKNDSITQPKIDGNIVCIFLNEFPFFSNNIPIKFIQISASSNNFLILVSSKIFASTISIYPAFP